MQDVLLFLRETVNELGGKLVKKLVHLWGVAALALFGFGCAHSQKKPTMTIERFQETHIGMSEELLVKTYGPPFNRYYKDDGLVIYEYVERFSMGSAERRIVESRRYYFTIKDGKIISKQMSTRNQPAYEPMNEL